MMFSLVNTTKLDLDMLTKGLLFGMLKSRNLIHLVRDEYIEEYRERGLLEEAIQITDGVRFPIPKNADIGIISEATLEICISGYRGWSCPNQGCGVAVYITSYEIENYEKCLLTLRLRIIHELLHHYQQPADDMDAWIKESGSFAAKVCGIMKPFSLDAAQWIYYLTLIQRIK